VIVVVNNLQMFITAEIKSVVTQCTAIGVK